MIMPDTTAAARITILDGGLGTTLEASGVDVSSSLWGSDLLESAPEKITAVHTGFIRAGADLIESATYPICVDSVRKQWPTATISEATSVLHKGLQVALASTSSASSAENRPRSPEVVLSLGPYGATTKPGAEYSGLYTPPYGLGDINSPQPCTNAFTHDESPEARASEEALLAFHLERLRVYVRCKEWKEIAWIGFETIPLLREVRAIRRAMAKVDSELEEQGRGGEKKPFWICGTFPGGEFPQVILNTHGDGTVEGRATVEEVVHTMMSSDPDLAVPGGIGLNCTNPAYLPSLTAAFTAAYRSITTNQEGGSRALSQPRPNFVFYPDGGQVYDTLTRSWSKEKLSADEWAERMMRIVEEVETATYTVGAGDGEGEKVWSGVIVGGCCKTSFGEIAALRERVDRYLRDQAKAT